MPDVVFLSPKSLCTFVFVTGLILEKMATIPTGGMASADVYKNWKDMNVSVV